MDNSALSPNFPNGAIAQSEVDGNTGQKGVVVTIDPEDEATVYAAQNDANEDRNGRVQSLPEILEHEIGGHGYDALTGREGTKKEKEQRAIDAENRYRELLGIPFRRGTPDGRIKPRSSSGLDW